jgi:hypothetical protein
MCCTVDLTNFITFLPYHKCCSMLTEEPTKPFVLASAVENVGVHDPKTAVLGTTAPHVQPAPEKTHGYEIHTCHLPSMTWTAGLQTQAVLYRQLSTKEQIGIRRLKKKKA